MDGIINVLKPPGMTSHDVVYFVRKLIGVKKCGHTGTLDPGASGVLPICLGKATKLVRFISEGDKSYRGELTLGVSTSSQDAFGELLERKNASGIKLEQVEQLIPSFTGSIEQIPPMSSAIKVNGKRLYQLEREGKIADVPARMITIHDLKIISSWDWQTSHPRILFDVTCSKGTYVRTLCSDIGKALGCGAYMSFLLRTRVTAFGLDKSITLEELKLLADNKQIAKCLIPLAQAVGHMPTVEILPTAQKSVCNGATLYPAGVRVGQKDIALGDLVQIQFANKLLGIYKATCDEQSEDQRIIYKPEVVLS